MHDSRRRFLRGCTALGSAVVAGCSTTPSASPQSDKPEDNEIGLAPFPRQTPKKTMLVLGGTRFLGPAVVDAALEAGYAVTLFNRGKSNPHMYPELEKLRGDRDPNVGDGLRALNGRSFDAVVDTSGYVPRIVAASTKLLAPNVGHYVYISSISAYASHDQPGQDESAPLAKLEDPTIETMGAQFENYGALKALCESAAETQMPGKVANVRPGFIVGPRDPTDRFTYWPVRTSKGGTMLAPGTPDDPIQLIDVRDLGRWLVSLAQSGTVGTFNATGPKTGGTMGALLRTCAQACENPAEAKWVSAQFLETQSNAQPLGLPIWVPATGETRGFHRRSVDRAVAAGLTFRPLGETVADTLTWFTSLPDARQSLRAGLPPDLETKLLARWDQASGQTKTRGA